MLKQLTTPKDGRRLALLILSPVEIEMLRNGQSVQFHGESFIPGLTSIEFALLYVPDEEMLKEKMSTMLPGTRFSEIQAAIKSVQQQPENYPRKRKTH